jgi:hypothetical protein
VRQATAWAIWVQHTQRARPLRFQEGLARCAVSGANRTFPRSPGEAAGLHFIMVRVGARSRRLVIWPHGLGRFPLAVTRTVVCDGGMAVLPGCGLPARWPIPLRIWRAISIADGYPADVTESGTSSITTVASLPRIVCILPDAAAPARA